MARFGTTSAVYLWCGLLLVGCTSTPANCPVATVTADPAEIPDGYPQTDLLVEVNNPSPENGLEVITELFAVSGTIPEPFAQETTYTCAHDAVGPVEVCVNATYEGGDLDAECSETRCTNVICPEVKTVCPIIERISADPNPIIQGDTTTVSVVAIDLDDYPEPLTIEWTSEGGDFVDPTLPDATFMCRESYDVEVCVEVSDGDPSCLEEPDARRCMTVRCPNLCPNLVSIAVISWTPDHPSAGTQEVQTRAIETDSKPLPLLLTLSALWGRFEGDETQQCPERTLNCPHSENVRFQDGIYICDRPGEVELCVDATDGACTKTLCTNAVCPDDIRIPP